MNKKIKIWVLAIVAVVAIGAAVFTGINSGVQHQTNMTMNISIENGKATPKTFSSWIDIDKNGKYELHTKWWQEDEPGFVTGFVVKDAQGNQVFAVTGNMVDASSIPLKLEKGRYDLEYVVFESLEDINGFIEKYIGHEQILDGFRGCTDGNYSLDYSLDIYKAGVNYLLVCILLGCVALASLIGIIVILVNSNANDKKYDERQNLIRATGYKYAFFTMLIYNAFAYILYLSDVNLPVTPDTLFIFGVLLGCMVVCTYSIWNDAYFAINENKKQVSITLIAIGIVNLGIGISNCFRGTVFENGKLGVGAVNLICGVLLIYVFIVIKIKDMLEEKGE